MLKSVRSIVVVLSDTAEAKPLTDMLPGVTLTIETAFDVDRIASLAFDILLVERALLQNACDQSSRASLKESVSSFSQRFKGAPIVVLTDHEGEQQAFNLLRAGVHDFLHVPFREDRLDRVLSNLEDELLTESEVDYLRDQVVDGDLPDFFKCTDERMRKLYSQVQRVAKTDTTVLITGETGTGKTVLAQHVHQLSGRGDGPFINVHCGAIPETLLESELFGHEKGAFTGAVKQRLGKFDIARGGTIFLDEIGTITPAMQVKLLQVLQDQTFSRIGGEEVLTADVRIVAATNEDLLVLTQNGLFRQDLYYRLNVFPIHLPPLRDRMGDLEIITNSIVDRLSGKLGMSVNGIAGSVMHAFRAYDWPGNVRELENLVERAMILEEGTVLTVSSFPAELFSPSNEAIPMPSMVGTLQDVRQRAVDELEQRYLRDMLAKHNGKVAAVADEAGLGIRQLNKLIARHGIDRKPSS